MLLLYKKNRRNSFFKNKLIINNHHSNLFQIVNNLYQNINQCKLCQLYKNRLNIVFGNGSLTSKLVFIGEAPGVMEDKFGEVFVGSSGVLLTKMIQAMGFSRSDVYICNVIKCHPPNNRNPEDYELQCCKSFLISQLAIIKPKIIITLGKYASQVLLNIKNNISDIRGKWYFYKDIKVMPTFHPAYLLRHTNKKHMVWCDLQKVINELKII